VIFAVLDASLAINLWINCSFFTFIFAVLLCCSSCCPWIAIYKLWTPFVVHWTGPYFIVMLMDLFLV